jgi:DNA-binding beta-propeller fold protein YncE
VPPDFTFNTPVGIALDRYQNVWVCDTGNNRVIVFNKDLEWIHQILRYPGKGRAKAQKTPFLMPFHLCPHPEKDLMFLTDMGNARIVVLSYDNTSARYAYSFGYRNDGINDKTFHPLEDPNGITLVKDGKGGYAVYVCDEFYHTRKDQRNRCVRFTEEGKFVEQFKTVVDHRGRRHDLLWPQGIGSDTHGNLFIANTGSYEVIQCHCDGACDHLGNKAHSGEVLLHSFGDPKGIGSFNIMRSVNVIRDRVFVADQVLNTISVYGPHGDFKTVISGMRPGWNHAPWEGRSLSDYAYYTLEDEILLNPYTICGGETDGLYFVTEPFTSRVMKIEIPELTEETAEAVLIEAVGNRRDQARKRRGVSQLNCVTSVVGFKTPGTAPPAGDASPPALPLYAACNPSQFWYAGLCDLATTQYAFWYDRMFGEPSDIPKPIEQKLTLDAGNWTIKSYAEKGREFLESPHALEGIYLPGDIAMAVHYPKKPLLGQICPGTPLVFVTNFNMSMVTLYQFTMDGKLLNYGLPFGFPGRLEPCLLGPQGIAVTPDGEIFIADSLNNRISKWRLLNTGQVLFDKTFQWDAQGDGDYTFTPTDIAVDSRNRLFVTDQFNDSIRVFDRDGKGLWSYGKTGYCDTLERDFEYFMLPTSLCIDGDELIINDLVNRALKIFRIEAQGLSYLGGTKAFKEYPQKGGIWMPYFIYAQDRNVYVPDSTFNVVNIFSY